MPSRVQNTNLKSLMAAAMEPSLRAGARRADKQVAIDEVKILSADVDLVLPPEVVDVHGARPDFSGPATSGDHLRLPQRTRLDGHEMRSAMRRFLMTDRSVAGGTAEAVIQEGRLHQLIRGLDSAQRNMAKRAETRG